MSAETELSSDGTYLFLVILLRQVSRRQCLEIPRYPLYLQQHLAHLPWCSDGCRGILRQSRSDEADGDGFGVEALVILHEHTGPVWCVAFSADGKRVASGSSDSTVKIREQRGRPLRRLKVYVPRPRLRPRR